jgi:MoaA/NifB/PqqE/SkfB family radical SAM enzyme
MYFIKTVSERCPSVSLNITTTIMDCNLEDIPRLLQLWEKMKIRQVSFQPVIPDNTDWNNKERGNSLWVPEHRLSLLDKTVDEIIAFKKKNDIISNSYYFLELIKHYFKEDLHKMKRRAHCYEGFKRFTITAGGRIWICGTEMKLSIVENGLNRCWNSLEVCRKRKQMLKCKQLCLQACSFE